MKATTIEGREKKNPLPRGPNLECSSLLPFKKLWKESEEKKKKVPLELHIEKTLVTSLVHYTIQLGRPAYSLLACCSSSHRDPSINGVDFFSEFLTPPSPISAVFQSYLSAILTNFWLGSLPPSPPNCRRCLWKATPSTYQKESVNI